jgi:hypothetical protein
LAQRDSLADAEKKALDACQKKACHCTGKPCSVCLWMSMPSFGLGQFGSVSVQAIQHLKDLFKDLQRFFIQYFKDF